MIFFKQLPNGFLTLLFVILTHFSSKSAKAQCTLTTTNYDFEYPIVPAASWDAAWSYVYIKDNTGDPLLGWKTSNPTHNIEFRKVGPTEAPPAYSGTQYVELNSDAVSDIYQDFTTTPGYTFTCSFAHRGRKGSDQCVLEAGPPAGPFTIIYTSTTDNSAWQLRTANYTIPLGQNTTRFRFRAIYSNGGDNAVGNFLDKITFTGITPNPIVTTPITYCQGEAATQLSATPAPGGSLIWYTSSTGGIGSAIAPTPTTATSGSTDYYVAQSLQVGCESNRSKITVNVLPSPQATIAVDVTSINVGGTMPIITFTGTAGTPGFTFDYTLDDGLGAVAQSPKTCFSPATTVKFNVPTSTAGSFTYKLTAVTDNSSKACSSAASGSVTINVSNPSPNATISGNTIVCSTVGASSPITFTGTNGTGPFEFSYTITTAGVESTLNTISGSTNAIVNQSIAVGGDYIYTLKSVKDATGITTTLTGQTATIKVTQTVTPTFTPIGPLCQNSTPPALQTTSTNGIIGVWNPTTINSSTVGSTTYTFTPNAGQCATSANLIVSTVATTPATFTVEPTASQCMNTTAQYTVTPGATSYNWSVSGVLGTDYQIASGSLANTSNDVTLRWLTSGSKNISVTCGRVGDCIYGTPSNTTTIIETPVINSVADITICSGETVPTTTFSSTPSGASLNWYNSDSSIGLSASGTGNIPSFTAINTSSTPKVATIDVTPSNGLCVGTPITFTITVNPIPVAPILVDDSRCGNGTVNLLADVSPANNVVKWYADAALSTFITTGDSYSPNILTTTNYYATRSNNTTGCVSASSMVTGTLFPNPASPAIITEQPNCATPTGTVSITAPIGANFVYSNDGINYQTSTTFTNLTPSTSYNFLTKNSTTGCISQSPSTLTIAAIPAAPMAPTVTNDSRCGAGMVTLIASGSDVIKWYADAALTSLLITGNIYYPTITSTTNYYLTTVSNTTGCESQVTPAIATINPIPAKPLVVSPVDYCLNDQAVELLAQGENLLWYTSQLGYSSVTPITPSTTDIGIKEYYVTQTINNCESEKQIIEVQTNDLPNVNIINETLSILPNTNQTIAAEAYGDMPLEYAWTPTIGLNNSTILNPSINAKEFPTLKQDYILVVTSSFGCKNSDVVSVEVLQDIVPPNAFSPNNDGTNDTWVIKNIEQYPNAHVSIFNRYGQFVYDKIGYTNEWDGNFNGTPLPVDTYFWIIKLDVESSPLNGTITIIR